MYTNGKCKAAAILSYLGIVGWIIGVALRERGDELSAHHLNQAFPIIVVETIAGLLGKIGGVVAILVAIVEIPLLVLSIMGIIRAAKGSNEPLPLIKSIEVIK